MSLDCTIIFELCFEGGISENRLVPVGGSLSELPTPEREGWVFLGWFDAAAESVFTAGQGNAVTTETVFTKDTTVYAHWRQPGDVNGDGEVDNRDVTRLIRCLNYPGVEAVEANMDTNGDKKLDSEDVAQLIRFIKYQDVDLH